MFALAVLCTLFRLNRARGFSCAADKVAAKLWTVSLFVSPRTLSADSVTWCGHLRRGFARVIAPLLVIVCPPYARASDAALTASAARCHFAVATFGVAEP